jgi:hypothetical protein
MEGSKMKKTVIILLFLVSCDWSYYIFENTGHPHEYLGIWNNIKTTLRGVESDSLPHYDFVIMQDAVTLMIPGTNTEYKYPNWEVRELLRPPELILMNRDTITYNIIWTPRWGDLTLQNGDIIYYLTKN